MIIIHKGKVLPHIKKIEKQIERSLQIIYYQKSQLWCVIIVVTLSVTFCSFTYILQVACRCLWKLIVLVFPSYHSKKNISLYSYILLVPFKENFLARIACTSPKEDMEVDRPCLSIVPFQEEYILIFLYPPCTIQKKFFSSHSLH